MRTNGERRPDEILSEIDRTRSDMDRTLHDIENRLTAGQLVDQGLDYLRRSGGREFAANLSGSVKNNPLPVTLVGIGLAWLMAADKGPVQRGSTGSSYEGMSARAGDGAHRAKETLGSAKQHLGEGMQSAREGMQSARERAGQLAQSTRDTASQISDRTRHQVDRAREGIGYLVREQPLALGAIGIALGAVLAAAAPRTHKEDELMGEASDRLTDRAKEAGREKLEQAEQVAGKAKEKATQEPRRTPEDARPARSESAAPFTTPGAAKSPLPGR
ncbi:MAG TPA: DUF3618 domain-containing protein [Burkholderiales bacterium]|nr:DUF3618 domain-containing protein [Burkholderiales bacterium]